MEAQLQIMSTTARFDPAPIFFVVLGIVLITVGMAVGLGKIGDAMVMNNPDAGNLYNPANVSSTTGYAGLVIGFFVAVGSAFLAIALRKWK